MDPLAALVERRRIAAIGDRSASARARYQELSDALTEWRDRGGLMPSPDAVRAEYARLYGE